MQIQPKQTVQKTLALYDWTNYQNWSNKSLDGSSMRDVFHNRQIRITQMLDRDGKHVSFETPQYTMTISQHQDECRQNTLYGINVYTTNMERRVYTFEEDDKGWKVIKGNRDIVFHFLEQLPDQYFVLSVDENAKYVSSHYQNVMRFSNPRGTRFID